MGRLAHESPFRVVQKWSIVDSLHSSAVIRDLAPDEKALRIAPWSLLLPIIIFKCLLSSASSNGCLLRVAYDTCIFTLKTVWAFHDFCGSQIPPHAIICTSGYCVQISSWIIYGSKEFPINGGFMERTAWTFEPISKKRGHFSLFFIQLPVTLSNPAYCKCNISSTLKFHEPVSSFSLTGLKFFIDKNSQASWATLASYCQELDAVMCLPG